MPASPDLIALGEPRFDDPRLAECQRREGTAAAWRELLRSGDLPAALARVGGEWAVGARAADGSVLMAVDRFGTHTLCHRLTPSGLAFAERADTLAPDKAAALDPQAIFDYLYFHVIPSPRTVFRGVQRLPAGHLARYAGGQLEVLRWFRPRFDEQPAPGFEARREQFRSLIRDAVRDRLDGGLKACFLSGGTDSSTVAGMIREVSGQATDSYSIGFEAEGYDEMEYARIAARHFGLKHHEYYVTPADLVAGIPQMARHLDQPFGNSSALPAYYCALRAKEDGATRMLAGDGGDELFGGNTRYAKQKVFGWFDDAPAWLRDGVLNPLTDSGALDPIPLLKKGASYVRQARVGMPDRMNTYNLLHRLGLQDVLSTGFLAAVAVDGPQVQQREVWRHTLADGRASLLNQMLAYDWRYTLAENDLPKVRAATSMAGVQVAYPLLDSRLLDFSLALPTDDKLRGFKLRWFFKEALRGFLPDEIITKKKHGFGLPFGVWTVKNEGLRTLARDSLRRFGQRGVLRPGFAEVLIDQRLPEHPGYYGEMVWILIMLEQWLQQHAPDWRFEG